MEECTMIVVAIQYFSMRWGQLMCLGWLPFLLEKLSLIIHIEL